MLLGLCVRSVCWEGRQVLVGTKCSEVLEVSTENRDNPKALIQVCLHSDMIYYSLGSLHICTDLVST